MAALVALTGLIFITFFAPTVEVLFLGGLFWYVSLDEDRQVEWLLTSHLQLDSLGILFRRDTCLCRRNLPYGLKRLPHHVC